MPIRFYCPLGHRLVVPDERAGKKGRCPQCHQKVYVPVADPQPGGGPKPLAADHSIELDGADGVPPVVLDAPTAGTTPRGGKGRRDSWGSKLAGTAAPKPSAESMDPNDPMVIALDEITAMDHGKAIVYMHPPAELPSSSASISKWLPPPAAKPGTGAAAAAATAPSPAPAAPARAAPPAAGPSPTVAPPAAVAPAVQSVPMAGAPPATPPLTTRPLTTRPPMPAMQAYAPPRGRSWIRLAEPDEIDRGYRPEGARLQMVYLLAGALMLLALLASWPALMHFRPAGAPAWVSVVLLMSVAQLVYVVWLLSLPDWSTLRIGMVLCGVRAAAYSGGPAIVVAAPASRSIVLGLTEVRASAGLWCAVQCGLLGVVCYGFGHEAGAWRDDVREMDHQDW